MAKSETKTSVFDKLNKSAFDKVKKNEVTYADAPEVPAGIKNGIAELTSVGLQEYKSGDHKGEPFFIGKAVVQEPTTHEGKKAAGLTITTTIPLTDRPEWTGEPDEEQFYDRMCKTLQHLGVETSSLGSGDLEAAMNALSKKDGIYFKFSTGQGKGGSIYSNWYQRVDYQPQDSSDNGVEIEEEEETIDWDEVAKLADKENSQAQLKIQEAAMEAGVTEEQMEAAKSWVEVVALFE